MLRFKNMRVVFLIVILIVLFLGITIPFSTAKQENFNIPMQSVKVVKVNNILSEAYLSSIILQLPMGYDLIVNDIYTNPTEPLADENFDIAFSVSNIGGSDIIDTFYARLYMDGVPILNCEIDGLASLQGGICGPIPLNLPADMYTFRADADPDNIINEINETNNDRIEVITLSDTCTNLIKDGDETDTDCGGSCPSCANGKDCLEYSDCQSDYCNPNNICSTPSCSDGWQNQDETDVDCGGSTCSACMDGKHCSTDSDCQSNDCYQGICQSATCSNGVKDGDETDIDCGGSCPDCSDGKGCLVDSDCQSNDCGPGKVCYTPSCNDGMENNGEEGVDCGGPCEQACPTFTLLIVPFNWQGTHGVFRKKAEKVAEYYLDRIPLTDCPTRFEYFISEEKDYGVNWNGWVCNDSNMMAGNCKGTETLGIIDECGQQFAYNIGKRYDRVMGLADYNLAITDNNGQCDYGVYGWVNGRDELKSVVAESTIPAVATHELGHEFGLADQYCDCSPLLNDQDQTNDYLAEYCGPTATINPLQEALGCMAGNGNDCCWSYGNGPYRDACGWCHGNFDRLGKDTTGNGNLNSGNRSTMSNKILQGEEGHYDSNAYNYLSNIPEMQCSQTLNIMAQSTQQNRVLQISLRFLKNDSVSLDGIGVVYGNPLIYVANQGDYVFQLLDSSNNILYSRNFRLDFIRLSDPPYMKDVSFFYDRISYDENMDKIKVLKDSMEIFSYGLPVFCNMNLVCEQNEDYINCPNDCEPSGADGFCNDVVDDICDPDCYSGIDADCCTIPTDGMSITEEITFCKGAYYLPSGVSIDNPNVVLDCNGAVLNGTGTGTGIFSLYPVNTVKNCIIQNYESGIYFRESYNRIENNIITDTRRGIFLYRSTYETNIRFNNISNNGYGLMIEPDWASENYVNYNNIYNNKYANVYAKNYEELDLEYNWWGTSNKSEISKNITGYPQQPQIDWEPWLLEPYPTIEDSDYDNDGQSSVEYGGLDCNDTDASIYYGAPEINDNIDQNCSNDPPILNIEPSSIVVDESDTVILQITKYDVDYDDNELIFNITYPPDSDFIHGADSYLWDTSYDDNGHHIMKVMVSDGENNVTREVSIYIHDVNRAPILNLNDVTINEADLLNLELDATDPDGDKLNFYINDSRFELEDNILRWQTDFDDAGIYSLLVTASDGPINTSQSFTIAVLNMNPPNITIKKPLDREIFYEDDNINSEGYFEDVEDSGLPIYWYSDRDGFLGINNFSTSLSIGTHIITANVTDSDGLTSYDTTKIYVISKNKTYLNRFETLNLEFNVSEYQIVFVELPIGLNLTGAEITINGYIPHWKLVQVSNDGVPWTYDTYPTIVDINGDGVTELIVANREVTVVDFYDIINSDIRNGNISWTRKNSLFENITLKSTDDYIIPSFADLDGDGDFDFVEGQYFDGNLFYHENNGNRSNPEFMYDIKPNLSTGWPSPTFVDIDADEDYDLAMGGEYYSGLGYLPIFYKNVGTKYKPYFIRDNETIALYGLELANQAFADLDNDGDLDMVAGGGQSILSLYWNVGNKTVPIWDSRVDLMNWSWDYYGNTRPVLVDIDYDKDYDLITTEDWPGGIVFFENTGTPFDYNFVINDALLANLSLPSYGPTARVTDLDNDNDKDLIVWRGKSGYYYKNIGTKSEPKFEFDPTMTYIINISSGTYPISAFADLDSDGDSDFLIVDSSGVNYYKNQGTKQEPKFISIGFEDSNSSGNIVAQSGGSAPFFADLDNDQDLDLILGQGEGNVTLYENTGNENIPTWTKDDQIFHIINKDKTYKRSFPFLIDLDYDDDLDLALGTHLGNISYYENIGNKTDPQWKFTNFFPEIQLEYDSQYGYSITDPIFYDFDNDMDMDLMIYYDYKSSKLYYYENIPDVAVDLDILNDEITNYQNYNNSKNQTITITDLLNNKGNRTLYENGNILIPLVFHSKSGGNLSISNITIQYENKAPVLDLINNITVKEGEPVVINASAFDLNNINNITYDDNILNFTINDSRFTKSESTFTWQTNEDDGGIYSVLITVDDGELNDSQNMKIHVDDAPNINEITFSVNNSWKSHLELAYNDVIAKIRINCSDFENDITKADISLHNIEDNTTFFDETTNYFENGLLVYNNEDLEILDSGLWALNVSCFDSLTNRSTYINWTIPWGYLFPYLNQTNISLFQGNLFDFNSGVKCLGGECGNVNTTLEDYLLGEQFNATCSGTYSCTTTNTYYLEDRFGVTLRIINYAGDLYWGSFKVKIDNITYDNIQPWHSGCEPLTDIRSYLIPKSYTKDQELIVSFDYSTYFESECDPTLRVEYQLLHGVGEGVIPTNNGTPFYTINQNPITCYNMVGGDSCNQTWTVKAIDSGEYDFFSVYNSTNYPTYVNSNRTKSVGVTVFSAIPVIEPINDIEVMELESVVINVSAIDPQNKSLTYYINDSRFDQTDNLFSWNTTIGDGGTYDVLATVSNGIYNDSQKVKINVISIVPPVLEPIPDIIVTEGDLIVINASAYDPQNRSLTYYINDSRFNQTDNIFNWQTQKGDVGYYNVLITASNGVYNDSEKVKIEVNKLPLVLSGYVFDSSGNPIFNASIELEDEIDWYDYYNMTDTNGFFQFPNLQDSLYELNINDYPAMEEFTAMEFDDENIINLTDDLEINITLLRINTSVELNSLNFSNGDTIEVNVTATNNEVFDLTDWLFAIDIWFENETTDMELYFDLVAANFSAGETKSHIFIWQIPENNTYSELDIFGGTGKFDWEVASSKGIIKAIIYKREDIIINIQESDLDNDGIPDSQDPDDDNDGINDTDDNLLGNESNIESNLNNLSILVDDSTNISKIFDDIHSVEIFSDSDLVLGFDYNFSYEVLNLHNVEIYKQTITDKGSLLIIGINLTANLTKTVYIDDLNDTIDSVCIKDEEILSIDEISVNCSGLNEVLVNCDGITFGNYTCTDIGDKYKIEGLKHSGVVEFASLKSFDIKLLEGWNLISIPLELSNKSVNSIFGDADIYGYNGSWFVPDEIDYKLGYWVKTNESKNITLSGDEIENKSIDLNEGWNLVGYPSLNSTLINETLKNMNYSAVYGYDNGWSSYVPSREENSLEYFVPNYAYWIYSNDKNNLLVIE